MILYLEAFIDLDQAKEAAEGWDGDRYAYLKDAEDRKLLVLRSVWDNTMPKPGNSSIPTSLLWQKKAITHGI